MEDSPFQHLKISSTKFLDDITDREICPHCNKSRKYFCYTCYQPMPSLVGKLPTVKLPFKIDIIKHRQELCGKSTGIHAAVLAPRQVSIYTYPDVPEYADNLKMSELAGSNAGNMGRAMVTLLLQEAPTYVEYEVVLVCPGAGSITLDQYMNHNDNDKGIEEEPDGRLPTVDTCTAEDAKVQMNPSLCSSDLKGSESSSSQLAGSDTARQVSEGSSSAHAGSETPRQGSDLLGSEVKEAAAADVGDMSNANRSSADLRTDCRTAGGPDVVVFIDCTWNQIHAMLGDERLAKLQRIELKSQVTKFWRHQMDKPATYLATIEAIYYTAKEHYDSLSTSWGESSASPYDGRYDNLLFFFSYYYEKIVKEWANGKKLKAYHAQRRKVPRLVQR